MSADPILWCQRHVRGRYMRDEITALAEASVDWFPAVFALLGKHFVLDEERDQYYQHALAVEAKKRITCT